VKQIHFAKLFTPPNNLDNIDPAFDPLSQLMTNYPNVENVMFSTNTWGQQEIASAEYWAYFSAILTSSSIWKLCSLPTPDPDSTHQFIHYFKLACHFCSSLSKLTVNRGVLAGNKFGCLKEFKNLTSLEIGGGVLLSLNDCYTLIEALPNLEKLEIDFCQSPDTTGAATNDGLGDDAIVSETRSKEIIGRVSRDNQYKYRNVRDLTLIRYTPSITKLKLMMERFQNLEHLSMSGVSLKDIFSLDLHTWPPISISKSFIKPFLLYKWNFKL
jgi:hypothetical protein